MAHYFDSDLEDDEGFYEERRLPKKPLEWGQPLGFDMVETSQSFKKLLSTVGIHHTTPEEQRNPNYYTITKLK